MSVAWQQSTHGVLRRQEKVNRTLMTTFAVITVLVAGLGLLYLGLVASSAHLSSDIWHMHSEMAEIQRESSRLETEIARLSSIPVLQARSVDLGYRAAESIEYVDITEVGAP
jgi:cell division protein FtsL